jgi:hypothetical protein
MWGYHDVTNSSDSAMQQPVCWITNNFDRSPAEMLWVTSSAWGPLQGALLNLSYGTGKIFIVPHEVLDGQMQGGMCRLPMPLFPTGVMRGRFHPGNGQLYTCGLFVWAGNQEQPGGFYRVRYTGKPLWVPLALHARRGGMAITFSAKLDAKSVADPVNYAVKTWSLQRTAQYGSNHYDEHAPGVTGGRLSRDGSTVFVELPEIAPAQCMEIKYFLKGAGGEAVEGVVHNTIHHLERGLTLLTGHASWLREKFPLEFPERFTPRRRPRSGVRLASRRQGQAAGSGLSHAIARCHRYGRASRSGIGPRPSPGNVPRRRHD